MAQLKDTVVSGNLRVTDTVLADTAQVDTVKVRSSSSSTTYGPGTNGQVLKSNGTNAYWGDSTAAPGTLNTTATTAQSTSSSESLSGNITLHKIAKTGTYSDLIGKPSIPAAPGVLNTNNADAQSVNASESFSGTIKLHKIAKTGSFGDLLNKPETDINGEAAWNYVKFYDVANDNSFALPGSDAASDCDYTIQLVDNKVDIISDGMTYADTKYPTVSAVKNYIKTSKNQKNNYLTFEILDSGNVTWKATDSGSIKTISYRKNNGAWTSLASTTSGANIAVVAGDILEFKGSNDQYSAEQTKGSAFTSTCKFNIKGNIMSLIGDNNFSNLTAFTETGVFSYFFKGAKIVNAKDLILPATTLTQACYYEMFKGCSDLITAPELPATTVADYAYNAMFSQCTSLLYAPELLATSVGEAGYEWMFSECSALMIGPSILPISTFGAFACRGLFNACPSLIKGPTSIGVATSTLADNCCRSVFYNCSKLVEAPKLPATSLASSSYYGMFGYCTSLLYPPELPATTLAESCYNQMFYNCSSLRRAPELPATTTASFCYNVMFSGCSSLNYIKCLATTFTGTVPFNNWTSGVPARGTFVKSSSVTVASLGDKIPSGWAVYNDPELKDISDMIGDVETLINAL